MAKDIPDIEYSLDDMVEVTPTPYLNLAGIKEEKCYRPKDDDDYWVFACKPEKSATVCEVCGCFSPMYNKGYLPQRRLVHDVKIGTKKIDLLLTVPRYQCQDCGATFSHTYESVDGSRQMTIRLRDVIRREAFVGTFKDVALKYGYSEPTIATIFDEYTAELDARRDKAVAPKVLGIDEKHIVHAARGVFVNIETGVLLEMTETNKEPDVVKAIKGMIDWDKNIEIVTMDMSGPYRRIVNDILPDAKIIIDRFHVIQDLGRKVKESKKLVLRAVNEKIKEMESGPEKERLEKLHTSASKDAYLFKYSAKSARETVFNPRSTRGPSKPTPITDEKKKTKFSVIAELSLAFPEYNHLRLLKEGFERIYNVENRKEAEKRYEEWLPLVPPTGSNKTKEWEEKYKVKAELYASFRSLAKTIKRWREEFFGYFDTDEKYTNAATEGLNCLTERINRFGNGISFKRLRAKSLYWHMANVRKKYNIDAIRQQMSSKPFTMGPSFTKPLTIDDFKVRTIYQITETVEQLNLKPLSVFSYLPDGYEELMTLDELK